MKKEYLLIVFMCASIVVYPQKDNKAKQPPNIIFILVDDLGWADLPAYRNSFNEAPNITRLANEGMKFTNAYAAGPVCSPTRASIMSGQYPARVGIINFIPGHWRPYEEVIVPKNRTQYLPSEIITIGEAMKSAGYATGYFGKWHLGDDYFAKWHLGDNPKHHPLNQGFDEANIAIGYYNIKFNPPRPHDPFERHSELLADFGEGFIEKNNETPFFLFLAYWDVHVQLDADWDLIEKYLQKPKVDGYPCNAVYAAMIEHLDRSVGRIVHKLDEAGLSDNTIIVFFSDNGGVIGRYDQIPLQGDSKLEVYKDSPLKYIASSNAPLRAQKGTVYEGGIRVPLLVKWPGMIKGGSISDATITSVDFYPTFLELAGANKPKEQVLDGQSLLPALLENEYDPERAIFWHYPVYHHDVPAGAVRKGDWKLVENLVSGEVKLYNLKADISEFMDLSALYPEKTQELKNLLKNWQKDMNAEFPTPNPNFDEQKRYEWGTNPDTKK